MGNMSYCRFQNTLKDLKECFNYIDDNLSKGEHEARLSLYDACKAIADNCEREDLKNIPIED